MTIDPESVKDNAQTAPALDPRYLPFPGRSHPPAMGFHTGMLASNADRERAIDVLRAGFAEGRLTKAEHDERAGKVYASRTYGDLAGLTHDLPAGPLPLTPSAPEPVANPRVSGAAIAALICGILEFPTLGVTSLPAVVLGHVALRDARKNGQRGEGLAIAGLVLGYPVLAIWCVVLLVFTVVAVTHGGP